MGRREAEMGEEEAERGRVDQERDDAHRRTAVGAEQRVDLVDLADELRAGEPALTPFGVLGIGEGTGRGAWLARLAQPALQRGVAVPAPVAQELLARIEETIEDRGEELEHVPARDRLSAGVVAPGAGTVEWPREERPR